MSAPQIHTDVRAEAIERVAAEQCRMHLVLYDGQCPLCNGAVRFLLRIDRHARLMFAPLQGETARAVGSLWRQHDESIILIAHLGTPSERVFEKSDALLALARLLGGWWRVFAILAVIPKPLRNRLYDAIARRRYAWFGRYEEGECAVPEQEYRSRFLP